MADPIEFYFEFSSPYAYFASHHIEALAERAGRTVRWRAILLGPILKVSGARPLASIPIKGDYSRHDWDRLARLWDIPWTFPDPFPIATLAAARAFYWLDSRDPELATRFAGAAYHAYFGEGRDITPAEAVADVAEPLGVPRSDLLEAVGDPRWKDRLRSESERAMARGVCGAPFVFVDGEGFWGCDRLWMVEKWLAEGGW